MGMLYGAQVQTMMPKLHSTNFPGHGTDPSALLHPRKRTSKAWRDFEQSPLHPMRLPLHGHLHHLRPGRPHRLQTHGNQKPDRRTEKGESRRGSQHLPQHGERKPRHGHLLQDETAWRIRSSTGTTRRGNVFFLFRRKERTKEKPIGCSPANHLSSDFFRKLYIGSNIAFFRRWLALRVSGAFFCPRLWLTHTIICISFGIPRMEFSCLGRLRPRHVRHPSAAQTEVRR